MLRSFVIDGFRTFEHLHLAGLGAVNLITGRNNVGKTVLLEALRLYGVGGDVEVAIEQLRARDEVVAGFGGVPGVSRVDVTALFHCRPSLNGRPMRLVLADAEERVMAADGGVGEDDVAVGDAAEEQAAAADEHAPVGAVERRARAGQGEHAGIDGVVGGAQFTPRARSAQNSMKRA